MSNARQIVEAARVRQAFEALPREQLPAIALEALAGGLDSQSLRLLAGLSSADLADAWDLWARTLDELEFGPLPNRPDAVREFAVMCADAVLLGVSDPVYGANRLWWLYHDCGDEEIKSDLLAFLQLQEDWEENPLDRARIDAEIRTEAQQFVSKWRV